eukprot:6210310-Pleurochrysis_carterae.AAC.3
MCAKGHLRTRSCTELLSACRVFWRILCNLLRLLLCAPGSTCAPGGRIHAGRGRDEARCAFPTAVVP